MNLRNIRERNHITQKQMADMLKITQQGYWNYENGKNKPPISVLIQIADFFNTSIDELVGHKVEYLFDTTNLTKTQLNLFNKLRDCSDLTCEKVSAYVDGLNKK